jgi:large conductance mechanosensitive channel
MLKEFKEFAMRGNVVDLAVGVIIGAAFGKIVSSLVDNIIMPPIGLVIGGVDFSQLRLILKAAGPDGKGEVAIGYGLFLQNTVNFLIIAWALFIVIQAMHRLQHKPETAPPAATPEDVALLREIRDLLSAKK